MDAVVFRVGQFLLCARHEGDLRESASSKGLQSVRAAIAEKVAIGHCSEDSLHNHFVSATANVCSRADRALPQPLRGLQLRRHLCFLRRLSHGVFGGVQIRPGTNRIDLPWPRGRMPRGSPKLHTGRSIDIPQDARIGIDQGFHKQDCTGASSLLGHAWINRSPDRIVLVCLDCEGECTLDQPRLGCGSLWLWQPDGLREHLTLRTERALLIVL